MAANGSAVEGVNVTWRSHPVTCPGALAGKLSRWQARYGAFFAVMADFNALTECRGTSLGGCTK